MNNYANSPPNRPDECKTSTVPHVNEGELSRTPPVAVRRELRREVGFGCPAPGCGNPYLQYHHFDPPWEQEHHHDPARMIALCATHHGKAEAWTIKQCRAMKSVPKNRPEVHGKFEWMRDDILAVVGGNLYYETPNMVVFRETPIVWFNRDEQRNLMLNLRLLTTSKRPRIRLENNDWIISGEPVDVDSPPKGNRLKVQYANGDGVSVRFREWPDAHILGVVYPLSINLGSQLNFPLVTAEISFQVGGTNIKFSPTFTTLGGGSRLGLISSHCTNGLAFS